MLPLRVRVDLGAMTIKGYSIFPKSARLESCHQMIYYQNQDTHGGGVLPAEMQSVYSTDPANWA